MDWQQMASLGIVLVTGVLLVRSEIGRRRRAKLRICGHDCGCSAASIERIKDTAVQESGRVNSRPAT